MNKKLILLVLAALMILVIAACGGNMDEQDDDFEGQRTYREGPLTSFDQDNRINPNQRNMNPFQMFEISSEKTELNSEEFPHTKAIQVQEAKFLADLEPDQMHPEELYNIVRDEFNIDLPDLQPGQMPEFDGPQEPANPPVADPNQEQPAAEPQPAPEQPQQPEQEQPQQEETTQDEPEGEGDLKDFELQVIELTNQERANNGMPALDTNVDLCYVARRKSQDMNENNYFSHTSPTYGSPFDMMRDYGIQYTAAGENIAQGQPTPEQVVQQWMESPSHRENILSGNYSQIGVGYETNGNHWTQMFINQ
ncbi:CAP domain-containing protein [Alteribacter lacisalsi]|uniref:CAP domain-containing protein n=1 Tax=Alteribacter lacisalsi TaxID=2045244 RepID=UPI0013753517|nr:CAP domain-containing protein [Alteribacter lacisalsi]